MSQSRNGFLLLLLWLCVHIVLFEYFVWLDWEAGIERGVGLVCLALYSGLIFKNREKIRSGLTCMPAKHWQRVCVTLAVALLVVWTFGTGVQSWMKAAHDDFIPGDMGRSTFQSFRALQTGQSPYGQRVLVDFEPLLQMKKLNEEKPFCFQGEGVRTYSALARYWQTLDARLFDNMVPKVSDDDRCEVERRMLASLGLKYGPAMLTMYVPFIWMWGKGGIFAANLFYLILFGLLAFFRGPQIGRANFWVAACCMLMVLAPSHIRNQGLIASANDLLPLGWAMMGYFLLNKKQTWLFGAFCLSLSFSAKFLPGLFFIPFLLRTNLKTILVFTGLVFIWFAPFWFWDAQGLWNNLVMFMLHRPSDSTALAHYLSPTMVTIIQALTGAGLVGFALKTSLQHKDPHIDWLFVLLGMCALLLAGKIFHNNYMLWVQVVFAFAVLTWLTQEAPAQKE